MTAPFGGADQRDTITTGVTGGPWRASVTAWGAIDPWDGSRRLDWYVAAEDRWHVPRAESTVRQRRVDGTAVVETRLRVPNGDVVQRAWSVPDAGGITVIEVENESPLPVAVAFDRRDVLTERPIADVPIEGIELPSGAFVLPLGHRATLRIGIAHDGRTGALPSGLPGADQVAAGWLATTGRASRLVLPDATLGDRVTAARCELALGDVPTAADDAPRFAVALGELVRMGEPADPWLPEWVDAVARLGHGIGWEVDAGLDAAARVLTAAGEDRARRDLARSTASRGRAPRPGVPADGCLVVPWVESMIAIDGELFPGGLAPAWLGHPIEAYGIPTGEASSVSLAIRWHGERPAILWEQRGEPVELTSPVLGPGWTSSDPKGEALWQGQPSLSR